MNIYNLNTLSIYFAFAISYFASLQPLEGIRTAILNIYNQHHAELYVGYKNYKFEVTENGFLRYKLEEPNHVTDYYSLRLDEIENIEYLGDEQAGWLVINAKGDVVIFQTYHDPKGDVDEMKSAIRIPVQQISLDDLNSLNNNLMLLKK